MGIVMDATTELSADIEVRIPKRKCLAAILIVCAINGLLSGILPEDSDILFLLDIVSSIIIPLIIVLWCLFDSEQWNFTLSKRFMLVLFLLWFIALPYYLSMTRKGLAFLKAFGLAVVFILLSFCLTGFTYAVGALIHGAIYS